jgi:hypothetical protein
MEFSFSFSLCDTVSGVSYNTTARGQNCKAEVEVNLRPTVNRSVCLGFGLQSGAHGQIFVSV